ncbi:RGS1-HXK1-interacting protein 1 [Rutidosis leptorrhynchoides]|uniref:RGS1-HXK1-interacting protein 1 n=1 Tax=Rutidosis leptorrhynchoides TaxID=125765 RepID=UPI003A98F274
MIDGEVAANTPPDSGEGTPENHQLDKSWHTYISEDLPRTVQESADSAVRSARELQHNSSTHIRTLQDHVLHYTSQYRIYEDLVFSKIKDQITIAREHSTLTAGIAITAGLFLMRGPRRFLFRRTLGRFQTEEAQLTKAANNVNDLSISVQLMKKESEKLLERAALAEKEMNYGYGELRNTGGQIKSLAKSVHKIEGQANDLVADLREIPGVDALHLRREVAKMASLLKDNRVAMDKRITRISESGVRV